MGVRGRIPGWKPPLDGQRISDLDRENAIRELRVFHERGLIDDAELEERVKTVESAKTAAEVEACFVDLRGGRRGRRDTRVTDDERAAALRRLALHRSAGQLSDDEHERRRRIVEQATVQREITAALTELPTLRPKAPARGDRLVSDAERRRAEERLDQEHVNGRLDADEHAHRITIVRGARTPKEIQSAFAGLDPRPLERHVETAGKVGRGIVRGGLRVVRAMLMLGWAASVLTVVIVWQVAGAGPLIPLLLIGIATLLLLALRRGSAGRR